MKTRICLVFGVIFSILLAACADAPSDPESQAKLAANLPPIQAMQPGDNQMDCPTLSGQIKQMQWDLSALDLQIQQAQNTSNGFSLLGTLASVAGAYANTVPQAQTAAAEGVVANAGSAMSANDGMSTAAIRATYQARYDNLVGEFNGKNCPATN